jgi:hypothetical protein
VKNQRTETALNNFAKGVISRSRNNLTTQGKNASKELYNSFDYDLTVSKNSFSLTINSLPYNTYGKFQNYGVSGVEQKFNTPYSYKRKGGAKSLKGMPPPSAFDKWSIRKGIAGRSTLGTFLPRKQVNFAIAVGVFKFGIKPTYFFTNPFENAFNRLPEELIEAYALDVEDFLKFALK